MALLSHWTRTSRKPIVVDGFEWLSYRTGINRYALYCPQMDAVVMATYGLTGYNYSVAGKWASLPNGRAKRFTGERAAMLAATKMFKG